MFSFNPGRDDDPETEVVRHVMTQKQSYEENSLLGCGAV
jgi:hypothetical protein